MTFSVIYCTYCVSYLVSASLAITFAQPRTQILVLNQCFLLLDNTCFNATLKSLSFWILACSLRITTNIKRSSSLSFLYKNPLLNQLLQSKLYRLYSYRRTQFRNIALTQFTYFAFNSSPSKYSPNSLFEYPNIFFRFAITIFL